MREYPEQIGNNITGDEKSADIAKKAKKKKAFKFNGAYGGGQAKYGDGGGTNDIYF